jgi:hypothetical protein
MYKSYNFSISLITLVIVSLLIFSHSGGNVAVPHFLITNDVEPLFICLFAMYMSSSVKYVCSTLCPLSVNQAVLYKVINICYIFKYNSFIRHFINIFSLSPFFFSLQEKFLILIKSNLQVFSFYGSCFGFCSSGD